MSDTPRTFTLVEHNGAIALMDDSSGEVFTIRTQEELAQLRRLLLNVEMGKAVVVGEKG